MKIFAGVHYCRVLFVLFIIGMLGLSAPGAAPGGDDKVISERAKAVIGGKGPTVLVLSLHGFKTLATNRLIVSDKALLYDVDGREITLKDLKIPCEAYVEYRRKTSVKEPQLYRLEVRSYDNDATSDFTEKKQPKQLPK